LELSQIHFVYSIFGYTRIPLPSIVLYITLTDDRYLVYHENMNLCSIVSRLWPITATENLGVVDFRQWKLAQVCTVCYIRKFWIKFQLCHCQQCQGRVGFIDEFFLERLPAPNPPGFAGCSVGLGMT